MLKELEKNYGVVGLEGLEAKALEAFKALEILQKKQEAEAKAKDIAFGLEVAEALARKPETCDATIRGCAVAYESHDCNGGWKLPIGEVTWLHIDFFVGNYIYVYLDVTLSHWRGNVASSELSQFDTFVGT